MKQMMVLFCAFMMSAPVFSQEATKADKDSLKQEAVEQHLIAGDVNKEKGNYEKAAEHYSRVIELKPEIICTYVYRAEAYMKAGKEKQACADLEKARVLGCTRPEIDRLMKKCN